MAKRFRKRRLTKKELKQDRFVESTMSTFGELKRHGTTIGIGVVLLLILVVSSIYYLQSKRKSSQEAISNLSAALAVYSAGDFANAISQLENHLLLYEKTKSGEKALFYLANSRYFNGDFEGAQKDFEKYLERYPNDPLFSPSALMGIAACLEEKGDWGEASKRYLEVKEKYQESILVPEALVSAGRCYEKMENWEEAERLYEDVLESYPENAYSSDAETYLSLLKGKRAVFQRSPMETPMETKPTENPRN